MDLVVFHQNLPIKFKELVFFLYKQGFKTGIVGGIPRDFVLFHKIGHDFDCELRPINGDISRWSGLVKNLKKKYELEELSYKVLRLKLGPIEVELTMPRLEHYDGSRGHSNFVAEHIADDKHQHGVARRDFTFNAIMFEYDGKRWQLIDPLKGLDDLNKKVMNSCSPMFVMDPVRFLRAFRFKINLGFSFSEILQHQLEQIDLKGLSSHYLKLELGKCKRPLLMLKKMLEYRPELVEDLVIHKDNKTFIQYDQFFHDNLEEHIKEAIILPIQSRKIILKKLGLSDKKILPSIIFNESWKMLIQEKFESEKYKQFYDTLVFLESLEIPDEKLQYLLSYYEFDIDLDLFKQFKTKTYQITKQDRLHDKSQFKYIILQNRLIGLL